MLATRVPKKVSRCSQIVCQCVMACMELSTSDVTGVGPAFDRLSDWTMLTPGAHGFSRRRSFVKHQIRYVVGAYYAQR